MRNPKDLTVKELTDLLKNKKDKNGYYTVYCHNCGKRMKSKYHDANCCDECAH